MPFKVNCPGCGKMLKARNELAGKRVKCPACGRPVHVPQETTVADTPAGSADQQSTDVARASDSTRSIGMLLTVVACVTVLAVGAMIFARSPKSLPRPTDLPDELIDSFIQNEATMQLWEIDGDPSDSSDSLEIELGTIESLDRRYEIERYNVGVEGLDPKSYSPYPGTGFPWPDVLMTSVSYNTTTTVILPLPAVYLSDICLNWMREICIKNCR